ncbi:hypothetical protein PR048_019305 [Dryococelus australis]|uniref:Uncharacterized protein n=1 Tax=Dryococelus australis TaxID=614101 RepID=A0ABQ9H362_9NEOP|nr:hypothetical protein PR048_019305 [Dryococelus australis]
MRVTEASMEQRQNERTGGKGDPRENPPTNVIVRHYSHMQKSGVTRPGIEPGSPQPPWPRLFMSSCDEFIVNSRPQKICASHTCRDKLGRTCFSEASRRNVLEVELQQGFRKCRSNREWIVEDIAGTTNCEVKSSVIFPVGNWFVNRDTGLAYMRRQEGKRVLSNYPVRPELLLLRTSLFPILSRGSNETVYQMCINANTAPFTPPPPPPDTITTPTSLTKLFSPLFSSDELVGISSLVRMERSRRGRSLANFVARQGLEMEWLGKGDNHVQFPAPMQTSLVSRFFSQTRLQLRERVILKHNYARLPRAVKYKTLHAKQRTRDYARKPSFISVAVAFNCSASAASRCNQQLRAMAGAPELQGPMSPTTRSFVCGLQQDGKSGAMTEKTKSTSVVPKAKNSREKGDIATSTSLTG